MGTFVVRGGTQGLVLKLPSKKPALRGFVFPAALEDVDGGSEPRCHLSPLPCLLPPVPGL